MNKILQDKINEAAIKYNARAYSPFDDPYEVSKAFENDCNCFKKGANYALNHQWISVDEALPLKRQDVLVAVLDTKSNTYFYGFDNIDDDNGEFLRDKNGFAIENDSHKITHWMEIPSLEGGGK